MVKHNSKPEIRDEQHYEQIVKAANVVIVRFNSNFKITDFSGSSEKVFGFKKDEVIGKDLFDTIIPKTESSGRNLKSLIRDIIKNTKSPEYNINENITKDGRRIWMQWYNSAIRNNKNQLKGILSIGIDITEKVEAEKKLKESEERFRMLSELTFEGILIHDNGKILDCNLSFEKQLGYGRKELIGKNLFSLIPEKFHNIIRNRLSETETKYEAEAIHKDGEIIPIMIEAATTVFNGKKVRVVAARNISEQKIINKNLNDARIALEDQTLQLNILNKLGHEVNKSLTLNQVTNASIEGIYNYVKPDFVLVTLKMGNEFMIQDYKADINIDKLVSLPQFGFGDFSNKVVYITDTSKEDNNKWENYKKAGIKSFALLPLLQGTDLLGYILTGFSKKQSFIKHKLFIETIAHETSIGIQNAILYDRVKIHADELEIQVKERTKELIDSIERLKELDKLKSIFLASMSHELRTPLNSIIGYTGILMMGMTGDLNEEQKKQLGKVNNNAKHLLNLINDILDISKIEAGRVDLLSENLKMSALINEVTDTIFPKAQEKGINIIIDLAEDIEVKTDHKRIIQVILNLVTNAVNYTNSNTVTIKVKKVNNNLLRLSVIDKGPGIAEKDLNRLFQPFQQIDSSLTKNNKGTGLGLYLCKKIMNILGGDINVKSALGKGSEFYLSVPLIIN